MQFRENYAKMSALIVIAKGCDGDSTPDDEGHSELRMVKARRWKSVWEDHS